MSILLKCLIERQNNKLFSVFNTATWRTSRNKHAWRWYFATYDFSWDVKGRLANFWGHSITRKR